MSRERRAYLDALGFVWEPHLSQWEEGFQHLQTYAKERGHCRVPFDYVSEDGFSLGAWVNTQRINETSMLPKRKARLNALGFVWVRHAWMHLALFGTTARLIMTKHLKEFAFKPGQSGNPN